MNHTVSVLNHFLQVFFCFLIILFQHTCFAKDNFVTDFSIFMRRKDSLVFVEWSWSTWVEIWTFYERKFSGTNFPFSFRCEPSFVKLFLDRKVYLSGCLWIIFHGVKSWCSDERAWFHIFWGLSIEKIFDFGLCFWMIRILNIFRFWEQSWIVASYKVFSWFGCLSFLFNFGIFKKDWQI